MVELYGVLSVIESSASTAVVMNVCGLVHYMSHCLAQLVGHVQIDLATTSSLPGDTSPAAAEHGPHTEHSHSTRACARSPLPITYRHNRLHTVHPAL